MASAQPPLMDEESLAGAQEIGGADEQSSSAGIGDEIQRQQASASPIDENLAQLGDVGAEALTGAKKSVGGFHWIPGGGGFVQQARYNRDLTDKRNDRARDAVGGVVGLKSYGRQATLELAAAQEKARSLGYTAEARAEYDAAARDIIGNTVKNLEQAFPGAGSTFVRFLEASDGQGIMGGLEEDLAVSKPLQEALRDGDLYKVNEIMNSDEHQKQIIFRRDSKAIDAFRPVAEKVIAEMRATKDGAAQLKKIEQDGITIGELNALKMSKYVSHQKGPNGEPSQFDIINSALAPIVRQPDLVDDMFVLTGTAETRRNDRIGRGRQLADRTVEDRTGRRNTAIDDAGAGAALLMSNGGSQSDSHGYLMETLDRIAPTTGPNATTQGERDILLASMMAARDSKLLAVQLAEKAAPPMSDTEMQYRAYAKAQENLAGLSAMEKAILEVNGLGFYDPIAWQEDMNIFMLGDQKIREQRVALGQLIERVPEMERSFRLAEQSDDWANMGGWMGTDGVQLFIKDLGLQTAEGALYMSQQREFVSVFLKSRQGSRPSDWDMMFYLTLLPSLSELRSESASARFANMKRSLQLEASAPLSPEYRKLKQRMKDAASNNPEIVRANKKVETATVGFSAAIDDIEDAYRNKEISGEVYRARTANAARAYRDATEEWKSVVGDAYDAEKRWRAEHPTPDKPRGEYDSKVDSLIERHSGN